MISNRKPFAPVFGNVYENEGGDASAASTPSRSTRDRIRATRLCRAQL